MLLTSSTHKALTPRSIKRHTEHVNSLKKTLKTYQVDLFSDGPAVSISTGMETDHAIINDILGSANTGNECYKTFISKRLIIGSMTVFDVIP